MKHFTDEAWLDFSRQLLPAEEMSRMRAHLDSGCSTCAELSAIWAAVNETVQRQSDYEPRESDVRVVKAAYASIRKPPSMFGTAIARLLFDSFTNRAVAAAGIRSGAAAGRLLLYESGPWTIEVRVDTGSGGKLTIVGQVLESGGESAPAAGANVAALRRDTALAQTSANEFGEFELMCEGKSDLRIELRIGEQQTISLNLPD